MEGDNRRAALRALRLSFEKLISESINALNALLSGRAYSDTYEGPGILLSGNPPYLKRAFRGWIEGIIRNYDDIRSQYYSLITDEPKPHLTLIPKKKMSYAGVLEVIINNCTKAIGYIDSLLMQLTPEEIDKLESLRREIAWLESERPDLHRHIIEAIELHANGYYIGSTLISAKIICYVIEKIPGKNDEEKADFLVEKGLIDSDLRPWFIRGVKRARNFFTHKIYAIPEVHESLELLSNAIEAIKILVKIDVKQ